MPIKYERNETDFVKWCTKEEFDLLISYLKPTEYPYKLMFMIAFYMGLRRREICTLKRTSIIGNNDLLRFQDCKNKKKVRERAIPDIIKNELEIHKFKATCGAS